MTDRSLQGIILALQSYWAMHGCAIIQPYDKEVGAGTFHWATTLRALGDDDWRCAYVQPSRRPADGRYGDNPNRLYRHHQFQAFLKPAPIDSQDLYLNSLRAIGLDPDTNDIRFVEDDWKSPTLGAAGMGWECWCNGMEVSQFTYFQQVCGIACRPSTELTYGLERLAMYVQNVEDVYELQYSPTMKYRDIYQRQEREFSAQTFEHTDVDAMQQHFCNIEAHAKTLIDANLAYPAYEQCIAASHVFNLLDACGAISVSERQAYIARVRNLAMAAGEIYLAGFNQ